jgi:hypothetical protein
MSHPGSNDPQTAYTSSTLHFPETVGAGGGGGVGGSVQLEEGHANPVLEYLDPGTRQRMRLVVVGKDGESEQTEIRLTAEPAYAGTAVSANNGANVSAHSFLTAEDADGNTSSAVVSHADSAQGFLRVAAGGSQTSAAVIVTNASDGEARVSLMPSGDVESGVPGAGVVLQSPNGTRYRITVANDGTVGATAA